MGVGGLSPTHPSPPTLVIAVANQTFFLSFKENMRL
jgi:hypothetical protein